MHQNNSTQFVVNIKRSQSLITIAFCVAIVFTLSACVSHSSKKSSQTSANVNNNQSISSLPPLSYSSQTQAYRPQNQAYLPQKQVISLGCSKALASVQTFIDSGDLVVAEQQLRTILQSQCRSGYETSQISRVLGYVLFSQNKYSAAEIAYQQVVDSQDLDIVSRGKAVHTLAQIRFLRRDYATVVSDIEKARAAQLLIGTELESLLARSYYRLNQQDEALRVMERVVGRSEDDGRAVKESWLEMLWSLYYQQQAYDNAMLVSRKLVSQYPKEKYWQQMAQICAAGQAPQLCHSEDPEWQLLINKMP